MDLPETIALAAALEIELDPLRKQLDSLSKQPQHAVEDSINELLDKMPEVLGAMLALSYTKNVWESVLATAFLSGVASFRGLPKPQSLLKAGAAYATIRHSGALNGAANTLSGTIAAIEARSAVLSKIIKAEIVQHVRDALHELDSTSAVQAQAHIAEVANALEGLHKASELKRHVQVQQDLAKGYGTFSAQQVDDLLEALPFQEFYREENRVEWRDWPTRWEEQGGEFYKGPSDYPQGRMIAMVDSKIWKDLASYPDGTGSPYPPFAFNSGMSVRPVNREEATQLGLFGKHRKKPAAKKLDFNADLHFSVEFDDDIKSTLLDSLQEWVNVQQEEIVA